MFRSHSKRWINQLRKAAVTIQEVCPREGLQSISKVLTLPERVQFVQRLNNSGISHIDIGSMDEFTSLNHLKGSRYVSEDLQQKYYELYSSMYVTDASQISALCNHLDEVVLEISVSETYNINHLCGTHLDVLERIEQVIKTMKDQHKSYMNIRVVILCAWGCPYEGLSSVAHQCKLLKIYDALQMLGIHKIDICDSVGRAKPTQVRGLFKFLHEYGSNVDLGSYFHNECGFALSNALMGIQMGAWRVNTSLNALG